MYSNNKIWIPYIFYLICYGFSTCMIIAATIVMYTTVHTNKLTECQSGEIYTNIANWIYVYTIFSVALLLTMIIMSLIVQFLSKKKKISFGTIAVHMSVQLIFSLLWEVFLLVVFLLYNSHCLRIAPYIWYYTVAIILYESICTIYRFTLLAFTGYIVYKYYKNDNSYEILGNNSLN